MAKAYGHGHGHGHADSPYCCFHPRETVVGVCAHCLKDRLLLLLSTNRDNADHGNLRRRKTTTTSSSSISLPKQVLALGSSFLQRLDSRHHRPQHVDYSVDSASVASLDDSFISIKFEDNGKATWDSLSHKQQATAVTLKMKAEAPPLRSSTVVVLEHVKRGGVTRWRKQVVGRLLQLARWKRSASKAGGAAACHAGLDSKKATADRSKARGRGWIRSLTRRRAAAAHGERAWS